MSVIGVTRGYLRRVKMCECHNVKIGSYDNTTLIEVPEDIDIKLNKIEVDKCIAEEIKELLNNGIKTVASCCGHNKIAGSICVDKKHIKKMEKLDYKHQYNKIYPDSKDQFYPKSI